MYSFLIVLTYLWIKISFILLIAPTNVVIYQNAKNRVFLDWESPKSPVPTNPRYSILYLDNGMGKWGEAHSAGNRLLLLVKGDPQAVKARVASIVDSVKSNYIWANYFGK